MEKDFFSVPEGTALEGRIQRLLFHQGYFAVRDIFIPGHSQAPGASTPDVDVLGCALTEDFYITKTAYDCKSGASQAVNRILWLQTVAQRIKANRAYIVRNRTKQGIKFYGLAEGINFIDLQTLTQMEEPYVTGSPQVEASASNVFLAATEELKSARKEPDVERAMQVIHTEFWFLPSCSALKRVIAQYERICPVKSIPGLSNPSLQWLKGMLVNLFALGVLRICGEVVSLSANERQELLRQRLVSDRMPYSEFASLVRTTFEYAYSVYGKQAALPLGDYYVVPPPPYTDSLLDLITRALKRPKEAILIPRFSECILFDYVLLGKTVDQAKVEALFRRPYGDLLAHYRDYLFFLDAICPSTREVLNALFPKAGE